MDITNKRHHLLRLWLDSFTIVNRCTGKLLAAILCSALLMAIVIAVLIFGVGATALLAKVQMVMLSKAVGITTLLIYLLSMLAANVYGIFFLTVCWQIVAAQALQQKRPLFEFFAGSVWPTLSQVVAAILLAIPYLLILVALSFTRSPLVLGLGMFLVFLVAVRLCYSFIAMAVANKGPIEGLTLSWKLTQGKGYIDALLMCLILMGSVALLWAIVGAIGYTCYVLIPLHFANSFNLAHPSLIWWVLAFILAVMGVFVYFVLLTFPVLVFLNRHGQLQPAPSAEQTNEEISIPLPELEQTQQTAAPQPLPPNGPAASPTLDPAPPTQVTSPAPDLMHPDLEGLEVVQTSVGANTQDTQDISQHLDKVYTPRPEHLVQQGDEDRMPTILFDDELAQQFQNTPPAEPKPADTNTDNPPDDGTIHLSK